MGFFQVFVRNMGVDLGRGDRAVAEHGLNTSNIGAVLEKVGRETVAEGVRVDILHNTGFRGRVLYDTLDAPCSEADGFFVDFFRVFWKGNKERRIEVVAFFEVRFECVFRRWREKNDTKFTPFAADAELFFFQIDVVAIEVYELGNAKAGREEEFEDCAVTEGFSVGAVC